LLVITRDGDGYLVADSEGAKVARSCATPADLVAEIRAWR
jgi:hypothetical protein